MIAPPCISNSPMTARPDCWPRLTLVGSSISPATPVTAPLVAISRLARWRNFSAMRPFAMCSRTRRSNTSTTPGPVPHVRWKRGTELPWPCASAPPRSAQPTTGHQRMPILCSQGRISPAAKSTKASATLRGQKSSGRSNCAEPSQSCQARSRLSLMPRRRCSGVSTMNRPPSDHQAWPPRKSPPSCSRMTTRLPASASSAAAARPASPAPMTTASASSAIIFSRQASLAEYAWNGAPALLTFHSCGANTLHGSAMPRSLCSPSGISGRVVC